METYLAKKGLKRYPGTCTYTGIDFSHGPAYITLVMLVNVLEAKEVFNSSWEDDEAAHGDVGHRKSDCHAIDGK